MSKRDQAQSEQQSESEGLGLMSHFADLQRAVLRAVAVPILLIVLIWPFWDFFWQILISGGTVFRIPTYWIGGDLIHLRMDGVVPAEHVHLLVTLRGLDTFSMSVRLSVSLAILFSIPWVLWNIWWFIKPGLYPHERKFGRIAMPMVVGLFVLGLWFGYQFVLPATLDFLLNFGRGVAPNQYQDAEDLFNLVLSLLFVMGLVFQIPLVVGAAVRFRLLNPAFVAKHRRGLIFTSAVLGAVLTPTGDPVTMTLVAAPIYLLVEGGLILGKFWRRRAEKQAGPKSLIEGFRAGLEGREGGLLSEDTGDRIAEAVSKFSKGLVAGMSSATSEDDGDEPPGEGPKPAPKPPASPPSTTPKDQPAPIRQPEPAPVVAVAPVVPHAPVGNVGLQTGAPEMPVDPDRPVPMLPRELRRRIDHYIRVRLEKILREARGESGGDGE